MVLPDAIYYLVFIIKSNEKLRKCSDFSVTRLNLGLWVISNYHWHLHRTGLQLHLIISLLLYAALILVSQSLNVLIFAGKPK